jgi:hypothetical protein
VDGPCHTGEYGWPLLPRDEIARTVDDPADIEQEITTLIQALAN